MSIRT